MLRRFLFISVLMVIVTICSREIYGQFLTVVVKRPFISSGFAGVVADANGNAIPGAKVRLMGDKWKTQTGTIAYTDELGLFRISLQASRLIYLEITKDGYQIMRVVLRRATKPNQIPTIPIELAN